jgi:two-component system sensor histidine kinase KdpD
MQDLFSSPDEVVAQADQIVNVDLPAEDLLERLQSGKIYPLERVQAAMANFFTKRSLTRLREMTLSESAICPMSILSSSEASSARSI